MKMELLYELKINSSFLLGIFAFIFSIILVIGIISDIVSSIKTNNYNNISMIVGCLAVIALSGLTIIKFCESAMYISKYKEYTRILEIGDYESVEGFVTNYEGDFFQVENIMFEYSVAEPLIGYNGSCKKIGLDNDQFVRIKYFDDSELEERIILSIERIVE